MPLAFLILITDFLHNLHLSHLAAIKAYEEQAKRGNVKCKKLVWLPIPYSQKCELFSIVRFTQQRVWHVNNVEVKSVLS